MGVIQEFVHQEMGQDILKVIVLSFVILFVSFIAKKSISRYVTNTSSRYRTRKFVNLIGYVLILIVILTVFNDHLTGITVFLGVAGAGIAFALQEVIASLAGFIVIHTSNFYKVGDRVLVGGIKGDVIDIGFLRTTLMEIGDWVDGDLYNGRMTRVANSFVFKEPVSNYSGDFPFLWDELKVPIKTDGDFEYAREKFVDILGEVNGEYAKMAKTYWDAMTKTLMIEEAQVDPMISMTFDENWITFTLRYVVDFKSRRSVKDKLSRMILNAVRDSDGRVEVASAAFEITEFPNRGRAL